jgi:hypothetical protein
MKRFVELLCGKALLLGNNGMRRLCSEGKIALFSACSDTPSTRGGACAATTELAKWSRSINQASLCVLFH